MDGDWPGLTLPRPTPPRGRGGLRFGHIRRWYPNECPTADLVVADSASDSRRSGAALLDSPSGAPPSAVPDTAIARSSDVSAAETRSAGSGVPRNCYQLEGSGLRWNDGSPWRMEQGRSTSSRISRFSVSGA